MYIKRGKMWVMTTKGSFHAKARCGMLHCHRGTADQDAPLLNCNFTPDASSD